MRPSLSDRVAGAVWGHLIGDAMGVPYEFGPPVLMDDVVWGRVASYRPQPPGTWSDDGGLMLALLDSLVDVGFNTEDQAKRALEWWLGDSYKPGPIFDIGLVTREALERIRSGTSPEAAGATGEHENGNGSLMRILPIALTGLTDTDEELVQKAIRASSLTHRHPRATVACALYVLLVRDALDGRRDRPGMLRDSFVRVSQHIGKQEREELAILETYPARSGSGYVVDCFWSAWDAFASSDSFKASIQRAISYGDDTDTTACVAGGLAGAYWGRSAIPEEWIGQMQGVAIVEAVMAKLLRQPPLEHI
jgi:ADP-ribosylglycohydrolase